MKQFNIAIIDGFAAATLKERWLVVIDSIFLYIFFVQSDLFLTPSFLFQNTHKIHSTHCALKQGVECSLWVHSLL